MNKNEDKSQPIPHAHSGRIIIGNYKGGDKKFFKGNGELLRKLLQNFNKST